MIFVKTKDEIERMRESNRIVAELLDFLGRFVQAGMTTGELDRLAYDFIVKKKPSRLLRVTRVIRQRFARPSTSRLFTGSRESGSSCAAI